MATGLKEPRFAITKACLHAVRSFFDRPKIVSLVDHQMAMSFLRDYERIDFNTQYELYLNGSNAISNHWKMAFEMASFFGIEKLTTSEFGKLLTRVTGGGPVDCDANGGGVWNFGNRAWRLLDTYGDEDEYRGADVLYTMCFVSGRAQKGHIGRKLIVADIYWDPEVGSYDVRFEASGRIERPIHLTDKRAFYYYPMSGEVAVRHWGDDGPGYVTVRVS